MIFKTASDLSAPRGLHLTPSETASYDLCEKYVPPAKGEKCIRPGRPRNNALARDKANCTAFHCSVSE